MFEKDKKIQNKIRAYELLDEIIKDITLCFTGHRAQKLPWKFNEKDKRCVEIKKKVRDEIEKAILYGYIYFISGMALGFDLICAEQVLELRKKYSHIRLIAALPCKDQNKLWAQNQIDRYNKILKQCDEIKCTYSEHKKGCEQERNMYMLNNSSKVIALYYGLSGGTKSTIEKANKMGLKVILINS